MHRAPLVVHNQSTIETQLGGRYRFIPIVNIEERPRTVDFQDYVTLPITNPLQAMQYAERTLTHVYNELNQYWANRVEDNIRCLMSVAHRRTSTIDWPRPIKVQGQVDFLWKKNKVVAKVTIKECDGNDPRMTTTIEQKHYLRGDFDQTKLQNFIRNLIQRTIVDTSEIFDGIQVDRLHDIDQRIFETNFEAEAAVLREEEEGRREELARE